MVPKEFHVFSHLQKRFVRFRYQYSIPKNFPSAPLYPKSAPSGLIRIGVKLNFLTTLASIKPSTPLKLFDSQLSFMKEMLWEAVDSSSNFIDVGYRQKNEIRNGYPLKFLSFTDKLRSNIFKLLIGMNLQMPQLEEFPV